jgi:hypothetical protein
MRFAWGIFITQSGTLASLVDLPVVHKKRNKQWIALPASVMG